MRRTRPTQADIARAAGVSQMTVSLALRNHPSLSAETRRKVRALATELGYRPNPLVSALMQNLRGRRATPDSATMAYVTAWPTRDGWRQFPLYRRYHEGAVARADQLGYRLEEFWLRQQGMSGARLSQVLWARGIHGVIIAPLPMPRAHLRLDWGKFALATLGYSLARPKLHRAVNHQTHSMQLALRELKRRGYQRLGLALSKHSDARADRNWQGAFLAYQPRSRRVPLLVTGEWDERSFRAWFNEHQPDAIIASDDCVLRWLRRLKKQVPRDVGFVHIESTIAHPHCASVRQNAYHSGAAAVDLVDEQLRHGERGIPVLPKAVLIASEWVDGPTVRQVAPR